MPSYLSAVNPALLNTRSVVRNSDVRTDASGPVGNVLSSAPEMAMSVKAGLGGTQYVPPPVPSRLGCSAVGGCPQAQ